MAMILRDWVARNHDLDEELNLMTSKADALAARTADISTEIWNAELHPGKKRRREVDHWLTSADEMKIEVQCIEERVEVGAYSTRRLRDHIVRITREMEELLERANFQNGLTIDDLTGSSLPFVTTVMKGQQFEKNSRGILSLLMTDEVSTIGVYGVGGVGKTTLIMHIHNELLNDISKCASVYWVTVSKDCTLIQLQQKIATELGIHALLLDKADELKRPEIISEALKKKKGGVVIFLDDLWECFPIEKIGLPIGKNRCRLIITTRSLDTCRKMGCQEVIRVQPLSEEESWSLFTEKLWKFDDLPLDAKNIAKLVAKECDGLPLGIVVIAASMRGASDVYEWRNALDELTKPSRFHEGLKNEVFPLLQQSYHRLNNVRLQNCFLSCALYPDDMVIAKEELMELWIMEGQLDEIKNRQEQLNLAHTMMNTLVNACLLDSYGSKVKMHKLVRDMAIDIARKTHMIHAKEQWREVPRLEEWNEELTKVSLMRNQILEISPNMTPRSPNLKILVFNSNPFTVIPDSFFRFLKGLKFLDLSWTSIERVPDSISCLENLYALNLYGCKKLIYVPSLVKLANLRHLNMGLCVEMKFLPQGMEKLTSLENICLAGSNKLCVPFDELVCGLSHLQRLELGYGVTDIQVGHIEKLECLERVCGRIHGMENFNKYIQSQHFGRLQSYSIMVGPYTPPKRKVVIRNYYSMSARKLVIFGCHLEGGGQEETPRLPHNIQDLELKTCQFFVRSLVDALPSLHSSARLTRLDIRGCYGIESIWSGSSVEESSSEQKFVCSPETTHTFESLETLVLFNSSSFRGLTVSGAQLPPGALSRLKKLKLSHCSGITKLFTRGMLSGQLRNLQDLSLAECIGLEEIFAESDLYDDDESANISGEQVEWESNMIVELPQLKVLLLEGLPKLTSICRTGLLCKSIDKIEVMKCPGLKKLPLVLAKDGDNRPTPPPFLRWIRIAESLWESLEWDNTLIKPALRPFVQFPSYY